MLMTSGHISNPAALSLPMPTSGTKQLALEDLQAAVQLGLIDHETLEKALIEKQKDEIVRKHRHAISQLKDGRWQTYYIHPKTKKRKDLRARSRESLIDKLFLTVQEAENVAKPSLDELFEEWLTYREKLSNSPNSVLRLRQRYDRYLKSTEIFSLPIDTISKISLEIFCNTLVKEQDLTAKEYSNVKTIIKGLFEFAYDQELIHENIFNRVKISVRFRQPKLKTGETETYSSEELELLQDYLLDAYHRTGDNAYIAVAMNFYLGLRVGELVALKWSDLNDAQHLHIQREELRDHQKHTYYVDDHTKTYQERYVHLTSRTQKLLMLLKNDSNSDTDDSSLDADATRSETSDISSGADDWIFHRDGKRVTSRQINYILEKYAKESGKEVKRSHKIRKTYGSTLHRNGVPLVIIKDELGHSDIRTTERHYIYNQATDRETCSLLENAL